VITFYAEGEWIFIWEQRKPYEMTTMKSGKDALQDNIALNNENMRLKVELDEIQEKYDAMHKTFIDLIEQCKEYRERMGYDPDGDWEYSLMERAKLI
jgi:hypothetical protein